MNFNLTIYGFVAYNFFNSMILSIYGDINFFTKKGRKSTDNSEILSKNKLYNLF